MITSPTQQLSFPSATTGAVLPVKAGNQPDSAQFGAFLAQNEAPPAAADDPQPDTAVSANPGGTPVLTVAAETAQAAVTGKILPADLPVAALPADPDHDNPMAGQGGTARPHGPHGAVQALPLVMQIGKGRSAATHDGSEEDAVVKDGDPKPSLTAALLDPAVTADLPAPHPASLAVDVSANRSVSHDTATTTDRPLQLEVAVPPGDHDTLVSAAQTNRRGLPGTSEAANRSPAPDTVAAEFLPAGDLRQPQQAPAVPVPKLQTAAPNDAAPPPLTQVRLSVVSPEPLRPVRPGAVRAGMEPTATVRDQIDGQSTGIATPVPTTTAPNLFTVAAAAPPERLHDFSALIDRLAAAREAAAPNSISISIPHADFGQVQLHFRHENGGLSVSLASADPAFAGIAAQAAPPVLPVGDARSADFAPGQGSARADGQGASASQQGGQHGQQNERRGEHRGDLQGRLERLPRADGSDQGRRRNDIFA